MSDSQASLLDKSIWNGKFYKGGWQSGAGELSDVVEKATGEALATVSLATASDVTEAAQIAADNQAEWHNLPYQQRAAIFRKAAALIEQNMDEIASWIMQDCGGIRPKADVELKYAIGIMHQSAAMLTEPQGLLLPSDVGRTSMARRVPLGVVGVIAPFNFPLILAIRAVVPALAMGNAVVLKPDPQTAVAGGVLIARVLEEAGVPPGVLHMLPGGADAGAAICSDPNIKMVAFTGSTGAGRKVGELCGKHLKKVSLELGGKNSLIILEDADLDLAASNAAFGAWFHQGQICMASGRILVHEKIAPALIERLKQKAEHLPVGDPMSGKVALGPMINATQVERVHGIIHDSVAAGAQLIAGGTYEKLFFQPTVLEGVKPGMRAFEEEFFGPVASITTFATDDEAVELANQTDYGLSGAIISRSLNRAMAIGNRLKTGLLHINDQTVADEPHIPFGGQGASGNGTRIGGPANHDEFTQWQWVTIKDTPPQYPF